MKPKNLREGINEYKQTLWLVFVIVFSIIFFQNLYLIYPFFSRVMDASEYLTWHILFEFMSIIISFCVFILPYYAYRQSRRLRGIFIGSIFLTMALLDTFHTLSYEGMPYFLVANTDANRATTFWIIARLVGAIGITAGSFIGVNKRSKINRNVFLAGSLVFSIAVLIIVTYFPNVIPPMYIDGVGITPIKIILEYIVTGFLAFAGVLYMLQYVRYKDNSNLMFAIAVTVSIFSELAFVSYSSVYDIYNYVGHVYKIIAFFIVFRIAFTNNIERPYIALYNARDKLKKYSGDLSRLVSERTKDLQAANQTLNQLNRKLLHDLAYAREIQKSILPEKLPNNEQVSFYAEYYPAERVSGDFYNIFRLDEKKIGCISATFPGTGSRRRC